MSGKGCLVSQPFAAGGNQSYLDFWAVTNDRGTRGTRPQQILQQHEMLTRQKVLFLLEKSSYSLFLVT
jgi:hypothetical protein